MSVVFATLLGQMAVRDETRRSYIVKKTLRLFAAGISLYAASLLAGENPKYVFLFIGDGMSVPQRMVAEEFAKKTGRGELAMNRMPYQVATRTRSADCIITDSAAAATAIACGEKTNDGMVGVAPDGRRLESVAEVAARRGMKVGIVTTTMITHATPAGFYAHRSGRGDVYGIGLDLVASGFDYFAGGGMGGKCDDRADSRYRGCVYSLAAEAGYVVATNRREWAALTSGTKALCTFSDRHLGFAIDNDGACPTLAEMVEKGVSLLDNPDGFFMMCEGGTLDFAGHANDAATNLREALALDDAVKVAMRFAESRPGEVLVIVTGDHETSGLSMGFAGTGDRFMVELLAKQGISTEMFSMKIKEMLRENINLRFEDLKPLVTENFGLVFDGRKDNLMFVDGDEIEVMRKALEMDREFIKNHVADTTEHDKRRRYRFASAVMGALGRHAGIGWSSGAHTALPTLTTAYGCRADILVGMQENTDIGNRLKMLLGE